LRVISWNLLRRNGAAVNDVAALVEEHRPDLLLMQEVTENMAELPAIIGGTLFRQHLHGRVYDLAVWSQHSLPPAYALPLPISRIPGRVPLRMAQIVSFRDVSFANVHLSHGQFLNRWQLLQIARALNGPAAIVGDFNAVGPTTLTGFKDVGPRQRTHLASKVIPFRLDRCLARGLNCVAAEVLHRGPSDHFPIHLELSIVAEAAQPSRHARSSVQ
jgi:endonuclease/exonuclease/phosphatase (EEP) superfamily protein YafD